MAAASRLSRLESALRAPHGYRVAGLVEQEATRRLATARLIPGEEDEKGVVVDLLFASSGIEPEIVAAERGFQRGKDLERDLEDLLTKKQP